MRVVFRWIVLTWHLITFFESDYNVAGDTVTSDTEELWYMVVGESQSGKTTLCSTVTRSDVDASNIGNGDGISRTDDVAIYTDVFENTRLYCIDTPGFLDTELRWSDEDLIEKITRAIIGESNGASTRETISGIVLVESLTSDTMQLNRNLDRLIAHFGTDVLASIAVIGTKKIPSVSLYPNRIDSVERVANAYGIPFVAVDLKLPSSHTNERQSMIDNAKTALSHLKSLRLSTLSKSRVEIRKIAERLRTANGPQCQNVTTEVDSKCPQTRTITETFVDKEWGQVGHSSRWSWSRMRRVRRYNYGWVAVDKTRTKEIIDWVACKQSHTTVVCHELDLGLFMDNAKHEWLDQNRATLAQVKRDHSASDLASDSKECYTDDHDETSSQILKC